MIRKLFEEQRPLMVAGTISLALFALMAILSQLDPTLILGISRWIKPMKFFISIAIFLGTIAIYLRYLNGERLGKWLAWGVHFHNGDRDADHHRTVGPRNYVAL